VSGAVRLGSMVLFTWIDRRWSREKISNCENYGILIVAHTVESADSVPEAHPAFLVIYSSTTSEHTLLLSA